MPIGDIMTRNVHLVRPEETLHYAASLMADWDIAFLPVADASGLVGTLTDRDIILRAVAPGLDAEKTKVGDIMTVWDDGVVIEKHVSNVKITEQEDGRMRTVTTFGDAITVGDGWERVLKKVQTIFGSIRAIANST